MNEESLERAAGIFQKINERYLEGTNVKTYLCVIPDKNYVLAGDLQLSMDYDLFISRAEENLTVSLPPSGLISTTALLLDASWICPRGVVPVPSHPQRDTMTASNVKRYFFINYESNVILPRM